MNIKADQEYAGLPLLRIQKLLKAASHNFGWHSAFAAPTLQVDEPTATHVIRKLVADGYIQRAPNRTRSMNSLNSQ